jgi:uncharacterized protein YggT (Ycf19 family)
MLSLITELVLGLTLSVTYYILIIYIYINKFVSTGSDKFN